MEVRKEHKQSDIMTVPKEWDLEPLGNHVQITSGASPSLFHFEMNGIPYFKVEQLSSSEKYLTSNSTPYHFNKGVTVQPNSIVFAKRGAAIALNKVRILHEESFIDTNLMVLTPSGELESEYLYYMLGYIGLWKFADTTSVPQINNKHIKPLVIPIPKQEEQQAIVKALSDVDALINSLDQLIAKKRDIKKATMQQLLTGKKRLPGFIGEWRNKRLGDVCKITTGKKDVNEGDFNGLFPFFTCSRSFTFSNSYSFDTEAILVAGNGDVGNIHYFNGKFEAYQRTYVLFDFSINVSYLWYQLSAYLATSLGIGKIGSSIPYIKMENLSNFYFNAPNDLSEQYAIAQVLSDMDAELFAQEQSRDKTKLLKQAMMQELLTGRIRLV